MDALTDRRHVVPDERATPFPHVARNEDCLDVARVCVLDDDAGHVETIVETAVETALEQGIPSS